MATDWSLVQSIAERGGAAPAHVVARRTARVRAAMELAHELAHDHLDSAERMARELLEQIQRDRLNAQMRSER